MPPKQPRFHPAPLALAVALALGTPGFALAQAAVAGGKALTLSIAAQPLGVALNELSAATGTAIGFSPALVAGKTAHVVKGDLTVRQAVDQLLLGTGLVAVREGDGIVIKAAPDDEVATLATVTVSGKAPGSTTEGTGSYTTRSSSSSTRLNLAPKETPQSLTVVTRQQIEDMNASTLTDVIEAVPGIHVSHNGIGDDQYGYYARGFEIRNFEVDGVPTDNGLNLFAQNAAIYDRVEVVRGATGLISGLGYPAATINLIRKRPSFNPQASISVEAGNWKRRGGTVDASGKLNESGSVRARVVADYSQQEGWLDRYKQRAGTLYGIAEVDLDDATLLTVGFNHQRLDVDAPQRSGMPALYADGTLTSLPRTLNYSPNWAYNNQQSDGVFASVEREWSNGWTGKAEYSYTQTDYDFLFAYLRGTLQQDGSGTNLLPVQWTGKARQHNLDLYLTGGFTLFGREHELIGGLTLSRYETSGPTNAGYLYSYANSASGTIADLFNYDGNRATPSLPVTGGSSTKTSSDSAYVSSRFHLRDDLKLIVGSRFVRWDRDVRSWSDSGSSSSVPSDEKVFVPYAGVVYDLTPQWAVYGSATKIFNPQGQWVKDQNNNALDPLEGTGYEIGVKGSHLGGRLNSSVALFVTKQDNLAVWRSSIAAYSAEESTTSKGVELEVNGEVARNWQLAAGYTHTQTTDAQGASLNTFLPRNAVKLFTTYRLTGPLQGLTLGGGVRWQSKTGEQDIWQGNKTIVSLMARYKIDRNLSVSLNVDNLFNRTYYSYVGSTVTYAAPRSVMVSAKYDF
ncbi:TonB-dependent siderophore receptor [plant metagenome]|uniref:TonB-dependent siderophore receptor n=1 Tax=plant metagenome TaxID=1297885 RepID=A0A484T2V1_9ZZZZ